MWRVANGLDNTDLDFVKDRQDINVHRKTVELKVRRLKMDAVPWKFPGCPVDLSRKDQLVGQQQPQVKLDKINLFCKSTKKEMNSLI